MAQLLAFFFIAVRLSPLFKTASLIAGRLFYVQASC